MGFIEWYLKIVKKISSSNIALVLLGKSLVVLALGVVLVQQLAFYGSALLGFGVLAMIPHFVNSWGDGVKRKKLNYGYLILDALGKMALFLVIGMVFAPFLWPMRWGLVAVGLILTIPATKKIFFK